MIYFLIYFFLEVMLSSEVAGAIGGFNMFLEIVVSALLGGFLISNFKYSFAESMTKFYNKETTYEDFIKSNIFSIVGAVLLIIPGVLTDILGGLMQFEFFAILIANSMLKTQFKVYTDMSGFENLRTSRYNDDDVIDVEVVEKKEEINHKEKD